MNRLTPVILDKDTSLGVDVVIVGSGAGGATTAKMLAEAGLQVLILEEGRYHATASFNDSIASLMDRLYRDGGVTPILGRPPIPYAEGRCVGGTTVINGGVYWRAPEKLLTRWSDDFGLPGMDARTLDPHFDVLTEDLGVKPQRQPEANRASTLLAEACDRLGWRWSEVPRAQKDCRNSNRCPTGCYNGAKQSMLVSYLPAATARGAQLIANARVKKIDIKDGRATGVTATVMDGEGRSHQLIVHAKTVYVCAGPMQTPFLLRRSGVHAHVGKGLHLHLNLKAVAVFPQDIDPAAGTIMAKQVKEFEDRGIFIGSSTFDPVYLALALAPHGQAAVEEVMSGWRHAGIFVTQLKAQATGEVHALPFMDRPLPSYGLTRRDIAAFRFAIEKLGEVLLAAGARKVYLPIAGSGAVTNMAGVVRLAQGPIDPRTLDLVSVHAMASCRLGHALDAFGQVKNVAGLYVNDASMLPEATGINPQMTLMAVARRNVMAFLEKRAA
jgi:choline dehydrogenase-like flavoprotein